MTERERDALGRPLPRGVSGVPGPASRPDRTPEETVIEAQQWLDGERPFAAHEIFEDAWKSARAADRDLWQGLAQVSVALTHALRGNAAGALTVLARARIHLEPLVDDLPYGIDLASILSWADRLESVLRQPTSAAAQEIPRMPPLRR